MVRYRGLVASCVPLALAALPVLSVARTSTANIDDVWMSLDSDGARRRVTFYTDTSEIHCIAQGGFGRPNVTVGGVIREIQTLAIDGSGVHGADTVVANTDFHPTLSGAATRPRRSSTSRWSASTAPANRATRRLFPRAASAARSASTATS